MAGRDFRITDIQFVIQQCSDNGARAFGRKTPVGSKRQHQVICLGGAECRAQIVVVLVCGIKIIQCLGHQQIGIRIELVGKFVSLIAQVRLYFELNVVTERECSVT